MARQCAERNRPAGWFQKTIILLSLVNNISYFFSLSFYSTSFASNLKIFKETLHLELFPPVFADYIYTSETQS